MPNTQQNNIQNETEQIIEEINSFQDVLKKKEKSLIQFQKGLLQIRKIRLKKGKRADLSQTKNI